VTSSTESTLPPLLYLAMVLVFIFLVFFFCLGINVLKIRRIEKLLFKHLKIENPAEIAIEAGLRNDFFFLQRLLTNIKTDDDLSVRTLKQELNHLLKRRNLFFGICASMVILLCFAIIFFETPLK
jgi:predicted membrane protein